MNKKQIKKLFKTNIEAHIPTTMPKIDWDSIVFDSSQTNISEPIMKKAKNFLQLKFVLTTVFVLALVVFGVSLLNNEPINSPINPYSNIAYQNTLSVSAVSTATLMSKTATTPISMNQAVSLVSRLSTSDSVVTIEPYLGMIETVTGQNFGISSVSSVSENPLYETKVTLTTMDLVGNKLSYTLYFNTTSYSSNKDQVEFVIEGIFLFKNKQFDFIGKKEIDGDEEVLVFKTITDSMNYVESSFKTENDESKYFIKIVENGLTVSQSKIKIEEEDGNKKIDFEFSDGLDRGQYEFTYDQENGKSFLKIQYQTLINNIESSGEMKVEIKIDDLTGITSYQILVQPDDDDEYEYEADRKVDKDDDYEDSQDEQDEPENEEEPIEDEEDLIEDEENSIETE